MKLYLPSLMLLFFACRSDKGVTVFNPNPEASITSHQNGDEILEGSSVYFVGNVNDANHSSEELTTIWKSGSDTLCAAAAPSSDGTTLCEVILGIEQMEITLEVKDIENALGTQTINLNIIPSESPVAEIIAPLASGIYYSDEKITFEGVVSDAEDDSSELSVLWNSDIDGELTIATQPNSNGEVDGATYLSEGEHYIRLNVEDKSGKSVAANVTIEVGPPNSAPS